MTVDYATSDGTAVAGEDYVAESGTLSFAPGETAKTVEVAVLDDSHDEGSETMTLTLSNASGARIADGSATGTINNTDAMPRAWMVRFGRTVGSQVVDALTQRLESDGGSHVSPSSATRRQDACNVLICRSRKPKVGTTRHRAGERGRGAQTQIRGGG